jgi:hypothetical protein
MHFQANILTMLYCIQLPLLHKINYLFLLQKLFFRVRKIVRSHPRDNIKIVICCFTINNEREKNGCFFTTITDHEGEKKKND